MKPFCTTLCILGRPNSLIKSTTYCYNRGFSAALRGSLKSLASCGSVRRREATKRVLRDKGTNLRVFHPADPEPSLQRNLEVNMKMVKSLILGSAAGLLAMSGAQAADLPVKAKAVEYVRICSLYGAGFFYIPGTDTCIKLGGYLRVETAFNTTSVYNGAYSGQAGAQNRLSNYYTARSREDLSIDTRTATEYGVVRTFFDATFSWTTGGYTGAGAGATLGATAYDGNNPAGTGNGRVAGGAVGVYYAFIQFAGFTMGKAISQFSAPWTNYPANNFDGLVGGGGTVTGVNQLTYTADFGNGVSGTLSAQDQVQYYQAGLINVSGITPAGIVGGTYGLNDIGGTRAPDLVAMVRVDQAWGLFQA